ncbi:Protein of unknown function [Cotesia congregata]|uniref:Uncharacterized protein n=1 Tax=Cotesia congregata TaxID=51543 RepID=A0A8J2HA74_COTCN|nr:Protein of unknown function [Cotesia congregata]
MIRVITQVLASRFPWTSKPVKVCLQIQCPVASVSLPFEYRKTMAQSTTIETVTITKPFKLLLMIKYVKWIVNRKVSRASVTPGGKIEGDCALFSASPP